MKLGILSDTHGHLGRTQAAIRLLQKQAVDAVAHCGDVGSAEVLMELGLAFSAEVPVHVVIGNVDLFDRHIYPLSDAEGVTVAGAFADFELDGKRLAIAHGHDHDRLQRAIHSGTYDYVLTGHTHQAADRRERGTRVINPGACYRSADPSIAVLHLDRDELDFLSLS